MTEKLLKVRWFVLSLLFVATTINYLDRGILAVLLPEIREQLHIDATSYGNITFWFQMAYAVGPRLGSDAAVVTFNSGVQKRP